MGGWKGYVYTASHAAAVWYTCAMRLIYNRRKQDKRSLTRQVFACRRKSYAISSILWQLHTSLAGIALPRSMVMYLSNRGRGGEGLLWVSHGLLSSGKQKQCPEIPKQVTLRVKREQGRSMLGLSCSLCSFPTNLLLLRLRDRMLSSTSLCCNPVWLSSWNIQNPIPYTLRMQFISMQSVGFWPCKFYWIFTVRI